MAPCPGAQGFSVRRRLTRASAATKNKEWERWPDSSRVTYHDRLEKRVKENKPFLFIGVRPDINELRHRRSVPLVVGTTSDGAALTWRQSQPNHPLTGAGGRLVLCGVWTFLGADRPWRERWQFTETPKRKARRVPPTFKVKFRTLDHRLPAWRGPARTYRIKKWKIVGGSFPLEDRQHYFGAWEQNRYVRWTRTPRPSTAHLRGFITQKSFLQHK